MTSKLINPSFIRHCIAPVRPRTRTRTSVGVNWTKSTLHLPTAVRSVVLYYKLWVMNIMGSATDGA